MSEQAKHTPAEYAASAVPQSQWKWYGHAAHLIVADRCQFHLCTVIGDYIISTVGDYFRDADDLNPTRIGSNRLYETFVFKAGRVCGEPCKCPMADGGEIDSLGSNDRAKANENHAAMCEKYAALAEGGAD